MMMNDNSEKTTTAEINRSWDLLTAIENPIAQDSNAAVAIDRMNLGTFRLVVMGEIKKGKSSFINALLGEEDLLPIASDVATSTVFKVIWGPKPCYKVFFLDNDDSAPKIIAREEIESYGTENGNPGNEKRVDFIGIEIPNPFLSDGLVIIDTPGVGGLFREHKEITWKYAPNADAIFFVLDSVESVISEDEMKFLEELVTDITQRVFFVQTKIDIPDKEQWQTWVERNKQILIDRLPDLKDRLIYLPVSSKLKQVADARHSGRHLNQSGFIDVINFIEQRLRPAKQDQIHRDVAQLLIGSTNDTVRKLLSTKKSLDAKAENNLEEVERELTETQRHYEQWHSREFVERLSDSQRQLAEIATNYRKQLGIDLDPLGPIVEETIEAIRQDNSTTTDLIKKNIESYRQTVFHECQVRYNQVIEGFRDEVLATTNSLYDEFLEQIYADDLKTLLDSNKNSDVISDLQQQAHGTLSHDSPTVRQGIFAASAGVGVLKLGIFLTGASLTALSGSAFVGAFMVAKAVWNVSAKQDRTQLLSKVSNELRKDVERCLRRAMIEFDDLAQKLQRQTTTDLTARARSRKTELKDRLLELQAIRGKSQIELKNEMQTVDEQLSIYQEIQRPLLKALA
tara:strand:+ start:1170 stop:3047 length:1878 start_codon:yes stop_codon:yes gene_type:complete